MWKQDGFQCLIMVGYKDSYGEDGLRHAHKFLSCNQLWHLD
jgi:hypothetical protein